jgi:hypothetical protein
MSPSISIIRQEGSSQEVTVAYEKVAKQNDVNDIENIRPNLRISRHMHLSAKSNTLLYKEEIAKKYSISSFVNIFSMSREFGLFPEEINNNVMAQRPRQRSSDQSACFPGAKDFQLRQSTTNLFVCLVRMRSFPRRRLCQKARISSFKTYGIERDSCSSDPAQLPLENVRHFIQSLKYHSQICELCENSTMFHHRIS